MEDLIRRSDAIEALRVAYFDKDIQSAKDDPCIVDAMTDWAIRQIKSLPSADRPQEWVDKAISIIDDMQREGIIDYEQAWDFRMRARIKGAEDE